jgi:MFS family permease
MPEDADESATPPDAAHRRARLPRTFAALRHRNYRLFFAGQLVSLTGTWMQNMALPWLVYDLTKSAFLLGLISSLGMLPMLLFAIPGGVLADRVSKRRILLTTQSCAMLFAFVLSLLTLAHWIHVWHIAALALLGGIVFAFDMPARQAFVVEMADRRDLMNAIALNSSIFNSARIFGPAVAGVLVASIGPGWCFFVNGWTFVAVLIGLLLMRFPPQAPRHFDTTPLADAIGGLRYLRSNATVMNLAVLLAVMTLFGWSYAVLMPVFATTVLGAGARGLGYLMTANGVGALIGALTVATLAGRPNPRMLFAGALLLVAALIGFSFSRSLPLSLFLLALVGLGGIAFMSTANSTFQLSVPDEVRGRIMGVWGLVMAGTGPIGSLQIGALAEYLGAPNAVLIGACITGVGTLVALVAWQRRRGRGASEEYD